MGILKYIKKQVPFCINQRFRPEIAGEVCGPGNKAVIGFLLFIHQRKCKKINFRNATVLIKKVLRFIVVKSLRN
jgi:hypothetical protein